ncbi:MAG: class I SAM-dependent methyltransferase [candidate division Zixibacteria bacterium]|nr:class I SAM-dependent methyltransferase [candidate division Zixibacteria bacterium]
MKSNRLYDEFAHLYYLIDPPADHAGEAARWKAVLREKLGKGRHNILDLGSGGGSHLSHFVDEFDAVAVDLSPEMIKLSSTLNPSVEHLQGDMRTLRLGRKFDAVLIHDAIGYMLNEDDLLSTFKTAFEHLNYGGLIITTPDYVKENFQDARVAHHTALDVKTTLAYFEYVYDLDRADTTFEMLMLYVIREDGKMRTERDMHTLGLFPLERWTKLMRTAGFEVEAVKEERGINHPDGHAGEWMFVGVK